jgi:hypothetical protein
MNSFLTVALEVTITTNRCVCKHYTASRPVLLLFCNTLEKSKSKSTEESTSLQVKSIQVVLKYCNALLLLRYRTTLIIMIIISVAHKVHSENSPVQTSIRLSANPNTINSDCIIYQPGYVSEMSPESSPKGILQHRQRFHNKTITYKG